MLQPASVDVHNLMGRTRSLAYAQAESYESMDSATSHVSPTKEDSFDEGTRSYLLPAPPLISAFQDSALQVRLP